MSLECEPICQPPCINGTCIRPNVCVCYPGYAKDIVDYLCHPVCSRTCVHGKCTAPEKCTCDNGYSLSIDAYTCEPVCTTPCGTNAYCSAPDVCTCLSGYENTSTNEHQDVSKPYNMHTLIVIIIYMYICSYVSFKHD